MCLQMAGHELHMAWTVPMGVCTGAKMRGVNSTANNTLSSYTWVLLSIYFLQTCDESTWTDEISAADVLPVLPVLQAPPLLAPTAPRQWIQRINGQLFDGTFAQPPPPPPRPPPPPPPPQPPPSPPSPHSPPPLPPHSQPHVPSSMTVGHLLMGFFERYACALEEGSLTEHVVSVRHGTLLLKADKGWGALLSVEDPYESSALTCSARTHLYTPFVLASHCGVCTVCAIQY
jgi:DNA polymerase sigma